MINHTVKISLTDRVLKGVELYKTSTQKKSIEVAIAELLEYALTLPPRKRLLETLRSTPEAKTEPTLETEEEQLAMVDQVRQEFYEERRRQ